KSKEEQAAAAAAAAASSRGRGVQPQSMDADGGVSSDTQSAQRGYAKCAVFVSRNRFAVLDKSRQLFLKTLKNETKRKIQVPNVSINYLFPGGLGRLLLRTSD